jgi:hypothetical protein
VLVAFLRRRAQGLRRRAQGLRRVLLAGLHHLRFGTTWGEVGWAATAEAARPGRGDRRK